MANALLGTATGGTVILGGANTYGGTTEVLGGTLLVNGSITGDTVTISPGTTLDGSGIINAGLANSTVQVGGTLAPGVSPGILTTNNPISLNAGSLFAVEMNGSAAGAGGYDQLAVGDAATVRIDSTSVISLTLGYAPQPTDTFTLIDNLGADPISGTFGNLSNGGTVSAVFGATTYECSANYEGGTGNDLVLSVVPETSSAVLMLGSLVLLGRRSRSRA